MKNRGFVLASVTVLGQLWQPAHGNVITVDARTLEYGTSVTSLAPNLTMSHLVNVGAAEGMYLPERRELFADPDFAGFYEPGTGAFFSGDGTVWTDRTAGEMSSLLWCASGLSASACRFSTSVLELSFSVAVSYVLVGGSHPRDGVGMIAFNSAGDVIASCGVSNYPASEAGCGLSIIPGGLDQRVWLNRAEGDISRVWFGSDMGTAIASFVQYSGSSVPEPGPLALFGLGLAGLVFRQRRRNLN